MNQQVYFTSLNKINDLKYFLSRVKRLNKGATLSIGMNSDFFSAPEVIVPCAGIIDLLKELGYKIEIEFSHNALAFSGFDNPFLTEKNKYELLSPMFKVWKYTNGAEVSQIVSAFVKYLNTKAVCAPGVVEAFEWTTNEVMDNVLQHSKSGCGYVMCTVTQNAHISFAVYDNGIGIYRSFNGSGFRFKSPYDAIIASMKRGFTRDKNTNQGNGLWGMSQLVLNNKGLLNITSSGAIVGYDSKAELYKREIDKVYLNNYILPGTLVDFQFQCNNEVSISEVFGGDYRYANLYVESLEDEQSRINLVVSDFSFGYTTRDSGESARNLAINMATQTNEKQLIILDFKDVNIISSSFADEFIAKLIWYYGFMKFSSILRIINVKEVNVPIINHAINQRITTEFNTLGD